MPTRRPATSVREWMARTAAAISSPPPTPVSGSCSRRRWPGSGRTGSYAVERARARGSRCTGASMRPTRPRVRHPYAFDTPCGAHVARCLERRRCAAADHALLRHESRPCATGPVSPARRPSHGGCGCRNHPTIRDPRTDPCCSDGPAWALRLAPGAGRCHGCAGGTGGNRARVDHVRVPATAARRRADRRIAARIRRPLVSLLPGRCRRGERHLSGGLERTLPCHTTRISRQQYPAKATPGTIPAALSAVARTTP